MTAGQVPYPYGMPQTPISPADRVQAAYQRRAQTDYIFNYWTAIGWTLLTCGIFGFYVFYKLVQRNNEHNVRRIEELAAARDFAWDEANKRGVAEELRPNFERIAVRLDAMEQLKNSFLDPIIWLVILILAGIAVIVLYVLLDQDLVKHDRSEGAIEAELSEIFQRLGVTIPPPNPARVKQPWNYVPRVIVLFLTCGLYGYWWLYDVEKEGNRHFQQGWAWEDELARAVHTLSTQ